MRNHIVEEGSGTRLCLILVSGKSPRSAQTNSRPARSPPHTPPHPQTSKSQPKQAKDPQPPPPPPNPSRTIPADPISLRQILPLRMSPRHVPSRKLPVPRPKQPPHPTPRIEQHTNPIRLRLPVPHRMLPNRLPDTLLASLRKPQLRHHPDNLFHRERLSLRRPPAATEPYPPKPHY
jgi:hypothetical protein